MLSLPEEIYLFALDKSAGKITPKVRGSALGAAVIGAVLSELTFLNRVSTDRDYLHILNTEVTGEPVLDEVLEILKEAGKEKVKIDETLTALMAHEKHLRQLVLKKLLEKGILKETSKKVFWVFSEQRYSFVNNEEFTDVDGKVHKLISGKKQPNPKDTALVGLLHASGLFYKILRAEEFSRCEKRIVEISGKCDIGQKINELIYQIRDFPNYQSACLTEDDSIEL
ncbi:MAG: GPP34 family phosphoprotein [Victivallaceae bacterium]|nr:GPP34 family phosphoprotein [Victivallaceae bacterium]